MLEYGWIKISRKFATWRWYKDANTMRLFLHLLITANYEDRDFERITVHRGQRVASRKTLAEELGISERGVRTAISHLISTSEVTSTPYQKYTVFTIKNYDEYQRVTSEVTNDRPASDQQVTSNRPQCKKVRKQESKNVYTPPPSPPHEIPEEEEVKAYALEIGAGCDIDVFLQSMSEKGWVINGKPVQSWRAVLRAWESTDKRRRDGIAKNGKTIPKSENAEAYESFVENL